MFIARGDCRAPAQHHVAGGLSPGASRPGHGWVVLGADPCPASRSSDLWACGVSAAQRLCCGPPPRREVSVGGVRRSEVVDVRCGLASDVLDRSSGLWASRGVSAVQGTCCADITGWGSVSTVGRRNKKGFVGGGWCWKPTSGRSTMVPAESLFNLFVCVQGDRGAEALLRASTPAGGFGWWKSAQRWGGRSMWPCQRRCPVKSLSVCIARCPS
mmetsp:Transcript_85542/g.228831  ORF Transcript_85542/g.228831 Transcript_85542/m.228831 type:complete len:214 (-) Transcript_85542:326-967(-)